VSLQKAISFDHNNSKFCPVDGCRYASQRTTDVRRHMYSHWPAQTYAEFGLYHSLVHSANSAGSYSCYTCPFGDGYMSSQLSNFSRHYEACKGRDGLPDEPPIPPTNMTARETIDAWCPGDPMPDIGIAPCMNNGAKTRAPRALRHSRRTKASVSPSPSDESTSESASSSSAVGTSRTQSNSPSLAHPSPKIASLLGLGEALVGARKTELLAPSPQTLDSFSLGLDAFSTLAPGIGAQATPAASASSAGLLDLYEFLASSAVASQPPSLDAITSQYFNTALQQQQSMLPYGPVDPTLYSLWAAAAQPAVAPVQAFAAPALVGSTLLPEYPTWPAVPTPFASYSTFNPLWTMGPSFPGQLPALGLAPQNVYAHNPFLNLDC